MKHSLFALSCWLLAPVAFAILDTNNNGVSDFWEKDVHNGNLFDGYFDLQDDTDADGWTNAQEATAGTNPFDPNPPDGLILPDIVHVPTVIVEENGVPVVKRPESVTVTWPTLAGKRYHLLVSPDLTQGSWIEVPNSDFISNSNIPEFHFTTAESEKLFWRVAVEDADSDGDGLTNHEEHLFGTDSAKAMTFPGIPDAWLAANFPSAQGFEPDGDSDGDGITNTRENKLGLDPNSADIIGLVNPRFDEEIFDSPDMSFRDDHPSDLYDQSSVQGWQAAIGQHIEIWDEGDDNLYVELQSHMDAHGVKQEFDMLPGTQLDFILCYKGRYGWETYDNAFKLQVEGAAELSINGTPAAVSGNVRSHSFMEDDESEKYNAWHHASISITAPPGESGLKSLTLSLVPQATTTSGEEEITRGGFVDLVPVAVEDDLFATGVDAVSIKADPQDIGYMAKFWIMAPFENDPDGKPNSNPMKFKIPANPSIELEMTYPQGAQSPATPTPGTVTLGTEGADCAWHGESPTTTEDPPVVWKMGAAGQTKTVVDLPIRVKTMKRRTVRVALHQIVSVVPGKPNNPPDLMPTDAQVKEKLNQVFGHQINAWFDVTLQPVQPVEFDIDHANSIPDRSFAPGTAPVPGDGILAFIAWSQPEVSIATANRPVGYDIHVYVLGGASPFQVYAPPGNNSGLLAPEGKEIGRSNTLRGANYCVIDGDRTSNFILSDWDRSPEGVIHTIAHEVGHILLGGGHPDEGGGDAPLFGTDRPQRLMCSGPKLTVNSLLLVKREWDKAEVWLSERPNGDN